MARLESALHSYLDGVKPGFWIPVNELIRQPTITWLSVNGRLVDADAVVDAAYNVWDWPSHCWRYDIHWEKLHTAWVAPNQWTAIHYVFYIRQSLPVYRLPPQRMSERTTSGRRWQ